MLLAATTQPTDLRHDPIWQFIGVVVALLGIIEAWVIFRLSRPRERDQTKILAFDILSDVPIANVNRAVQDRVKILFDNEPAQDMRLVVLKLWNDGEVAEVLATWHLMDRW